MKGLSIIKQRIPSTPITVSLLNAQTLAQTPTDAHDQAAQQTGMRERPRSKHYRTCSQWHPYTNVAGTCAVDINSKTNFQTRIEINAEFSVRFQT
jgi:hypothetical protein